MLKTNQYRVVNRRLIVERQPGKLVVTNPLLYLRHRIIRLCRLSKSSIICVDGRWIFRYENYNDRFADTEEELLQIENKLLKDLGIVE